MKRKIKLVLVLLVLVVGGFGIYAYKLRLLANEGNDLFEQRCFYVNPPLISYKNSFLEIADMLNNPENYEAGSLTDPFENYIFQMEGYVGEESKWLDAQSAYVNRWDFQLFEPWYIKQASDYQLKMYEAYRDDAKYMLETYNNRGASEEITAKFNEARSRRDKYSELYHDFFDEALMIRDWRKILGSVPIPEGCTEENMIIPNTSGSIDWEGDDENKAPLLLDPNLVS